MTGTISLSEAAQKLLLEDFMNKGVGFRHGQVCCWQSLTFMHPCKQCATMTAS